MNISNDFIIKTNKDGLSLIYPKHNAINWNEDNLIYRSSIWDGDKPVSLSFRKFFNLEERTDITGMFRNDLRNTSIVEKIDGSTLIVSKYKGNLIIRTRSTFDVKNMNNGWEINELKQIYPIAFSNTYINSEKYSMIFEWVSPDNQIVIEYKKYDLFLIGMIKHIDYSYASQILLDDMANSYWLKRPRTYIFTDLKEMIRRVDTWNNREGVCIYYNNDQNIRKIKSIDYLKKHVFKFHLTLEKILDLWLISKPPDYSSFRTFISNEFDYEIANMCVDYIHLILNAHRQFCSIKHELLVDVLCNCGKTKKEFASFINNKYDDMINRAIAFCLWDKKDIPDRIIKNKMLEYLSIEQEINLESISSQSKV